MYCMFNVLVTKPDTSYLYTLLILRVVLPLSTHNFAGLSIFSPHTILLHWQDLLTTTIQSVQLPRPTLSLVASRCIQKETHDNTTMRMQGTYTWMRK